ncbi:hypothetical protein ABZW11_28035 [Nonomuraea sp. NPDC004580]|uniref:hypothetical protein n=1 Tax=Nonomuraea sp. NPDC004580 TaxID=3154552 RepID=UPI0033B888F1
MTRRGPLLLATALITATVTGPATTGLGPPPQRGALTAADRAAHQAHAPATAPPSPHAQQLSRYAAAAPMRHAPVASHVPMAAAQGVAGPERVQPGGGREGVVLVASRRVRVAARVTGPGRVPPPRQPARPLVRQMPVPKPGAVPKTRAVPKPRPVPKVSVRPPAPPKRVRVGRDVRVPRVWVQSSPRPRVSIAMPDAKRHAAPKVTVPHVTVYPDGLCAGDVQLGECPRGRPRQVQRGVPPLVPAEVVLPPTPTLTPTPTPSPTPSARSHVIRAEPAERRRNPLSTVLLTVVLVTAITSTTAVAFRARR